MRHRVAGAGVARLATVRPDGTPHVVPCCFVLDGEVVFTPVDDVKPKSTLALARVANLAAQPAASVLVDHYDEDWATLWWVRLDGTGRVVDDPAERARALDGLADKYPPYASQPPPGPIIALDVATWRAWP